MPDGRPPAIPENPTTAGVSDISLAPEEEQAAGVSLRENRQRERTRSRIRRGLRGGSQSLDTSLFRDRSSTGYEEATAEAGMADDEGFGAVVGSSADAAVSSRLQQLQQQSRRRRTGEHENIANDFKERFSAATQEIQKQMLRELEEGEEELGKEGHRLLRWALKWYITAQARKAATWTVQKLGLWAALTGAISTLILIPLALAVLNFWLWISVQDKFYRIPFWMKMYWYEKVAVILIDIICVILIMIQLVFIAILVWAMAHPYAAFRLIFGSGLKAFWDLIKLGLAAVF